MAGKGNIGNLIIRKKGDPPLPGAGRPKDHEHVSYMAREFTARAIAVLGEILMNPALKAEARVKAAETLLNRGWGKPKEEIQLTGANGGPVAIASLGLDMAKLPTESLERLLKLLEPARVEAPALPEALPEQDTLDTNTTVVAELPK